MHKGWLFSYLHTRNCSYNFWKTSVQNQNEFLVTCCLIKLRRCPLPSCLSVKCRSIPSLTLGRNYYFHFHPFTLLHGPRKREKIKSVWPDDLREEIVSIPTKRKLVTASGNADKQKPRTQSRFLFQNECWPLCSKHFAGCCFKNRTFHTLSSSLGFSYPSLPPPNRALVSNQYFSIHSQ